MTSDPIRATVIKKAAHLCIVEGCHGKRWGKQSFCFKCLERMKADEQEAVTYRVTNEGGLMITYKRVPKVIDTKDGPVAIL